MDTFVYICKRLLMMIPVIFIVALFVFSLLHFGSGDPAAIIAGDQATQADVERIRAALGLDRPFATRFFEWLFNVVRGDLGISVYSNLPVARLIADRIQPTQHLMILTIVLSVGIAVPLGVLAAWAAGTWIDNLVMTLAVIGFSVPVFVIGYLLAYFFALDLRWFPVQGYVPWEQGFLPSNRSLVLPAIALASAYMALISRITRAVMLETLSQDYIRTATAKGATQRAILFIHALKNAAVPIVTIIGSGIAHLIGGAVAVETVFAIPGLGRLTADAILQRDYPVIQGVVLFSSLIYVIVNLCVDLIYVIVDPRIKY